MFTRICIMAILLAASVSSLRAATTPLQMEGRFAYDNVIPVLLNAGAGDQQDIARLYWIVFSKQDRRLRADLRMVLVSWPKGKWQVGVDLLGKGNVVLKSVQSVVENGGFIISVPAYSEEDMHFDLGPSKDVEGARRFRVTIRPAAEDAKVDADITHPSEHGYSVEGNRSIDLRVVDADGTPASADITLWRKVGSDYIECQDHGCENRQTASDRAGPALCAQRHARRGRLVRVPHDRERRRHDALRVSDVRHISS